MAEQEKKKSTKTFDREEAVDTTVARVREISDDYGRVVRSWTDAGIEYWTGVARVVGDYWNNTTDTLRSGFDRRREEEEADSYAAGTGVLSDLSHHTAQMYANSARLVADSMHRFGEVFEEKERPAKTSKAKAATATAAK